MHAHRTFTEKKLKPKEMIDLGAYLPFQQRATNCEVTRQKNELTFQGSGKLWGGKYAGKLMEDMG